MENFTPVASLAGGALIGLAASWLLLANGRIAGISGITGGLFGAAKSEWPWRLAFVGGLVLGGLAMAFLQPGMFQDTLNLPLWDVVLAAVLVGVGTRLGNGCTSGHGVCGLTRFSPRSAVAVATFMTTGGVAAFLASRFIMGGAG